MDFHSITDPYIPSWAKSEAQGTASLFDCNEQQPMENNPFDCNEQQPMENNYSNPNNENMQAFSDLNNEQQQQQQQQPLENNYSNANNENMQAFSDHNNGSDVPLEGSNFFGDNVPVMEDSNLLWPVSQFEAGEGLPYAPIDWPNPGDTWTWRVGRRVNSVGFFQDRFLYPPKHIVPPGAPKYFASKAACENFVKSNFPGADVGALFASFSWKIPGKAPPKVEPTPAPMAETSEAKVETVEENKDNPTPRYSKRERKKKIEKADVEEDSAEPKAKVPRSTTPRKRKQAGDPSSITSPAGTTQRKSRGSSRRASRLAPGHDEQQQEATVNLIPEDFDNYLNSLEDMLGQPIAAEPQFPASLFEDSSVPDDEMVKARNKLSSLLQKDFHLWLSSKNFSQLTTLASKIRQDPTLTADQLVKLKLIDELPLFSEVYSESRQAIHQVDKFFTTLDGNKNKIASMKHEYSELKDKADQLQSLVDSSLMAVKDIDDQIAQLKARRAELTKTIETNKAAKVDLSFSQKMVASSIPSVVHDIQVANSKISEMEMKKINAQRREYEILEKFAPLKGFAL